MIDAEIRIRCIEAAAAVPGNPNTLQLAKTFYEFVMEAAEAPVEGKIEDAIHTITPVESPLMKNLKKVSKK
jgi:hypothetical protein